MKKNLEKFLETRFSSSYVKWKDWGHNFANLKKNQYAYYKAEIRRSKHKFQACSNVLEIGFGNGSFLNYAKQMHWNIKGTEMNLDLVNLAKSNNYDVLHTDNLLTFPDNKFDLVVAFDVLEHIPEDKLIDFMLEIKRVLVFDGIFIARFPNGDSPFGLKIQNGDFTHISSIGSGKVFSLESITNMKLIFLGGEAQPIMGTNILNFSHKILAIPIKFILNFFICLIFFPREKVDFTSSNLSAIFKK